MFIKLNFKRINLGIVLVFCLVGFASRADLGKVFVKIHSVVGGNLDYTAANVGAMVGNTLEVVEKVCENEAVLNRAFALLESDNMIFLNGILKVVNNLLKRLDVGGKVYVVFNKSLTC